MRLAHVILLTGVVATAPAGASAKVASLTASIPSTATVGTPVTVTVTVRGPGTLLLQRSASGRYTTLQSRRLTRATRQVTLSWRPAKPMTVGLRVVKRKGRHVVARSKTLKVTVQGTGPSAPVGGQSGGATAPPPASGTSPVPSSTPPPVVTPGPGDSLAPGQTLASGRSLVSPNGRTRLSMQGDGDLVLFRDGAKRWSTGPQGAGATARLQSDGNLAVGAHWTSTTSGFSGARLVVQDDGNLVIYHAGHAIWTYDRGYIGDILGIDWSLQPGAYLLSHDRHFKLVMQDSDGNLVLYRDGQALWATGAAGAGARVSMQGDGNLVVYQGTEPRWSSNTADFPGATLALQDDGNLVVYHLGGHPIWDWGSGYFGDKLLGWTLGPGSYLLSADHRFQLAMQGTDGNLVVYRRDPLSAAWASGAAGAGAKAVMQGDGNFVLYDAGGTARWNSGTAGHAGAYVIMQNDGNLVVYQGAGALWSSMGGPIGGGGAVDASDGYPYKNAYACGPNYDWCINGSEISPYGYAYRNCTDFAAWWLRSHGVADAKVRGLGNAVTWASRAASHGDVADHNPTPGSIAQWGSEVGGGFGHVAVVTSVNADGTVNVAEYNHFGNGTYGTRQHIRADFYIHF